MSVFDRPIIVVDIETLTTIPHAHGITSVGMVKIMPHSRQPLIKQVANFRMIPTTPSLSTDTDKYRKEKGIGEMEQSIETVYSRPTAIQYLQKIIADNENAFWCAKGVGFDFGFLNLLLATGPADSINQFPYQSLIDVRCFVAIADHNPSKSMTYKESATLWTQGRMRQLGLPASPHFALYDAYEEAYLMHLIINDLRDALVD